jgi:DnaJ-class molecular chaperone
MDFKEIEGARKILGLGETATMREIRESYRNLVLECHPDRAGERKSAGNGRFREITAAYEVLVSYCSSYRYSFRKNDLQDDSEAGMDEDFLKNYFDGWITDPGNEGKQSP